MIAYDFNNQELYIDDIVFLTPWNKSNEINKGKIIRLTKKTVIIGLINESDDTMFWNVTIRKINTPTRVIKI